MTKEQMPDLDQDDTQLVAECRAGGRDAFGRIVERYQSLICSLAYSATGCVSQSEDLAQETFVTAWTQLPELREPAKLRPWLCAIARNLIGKALRRDGREPAHDAQPLEAAQDSAAAGPIQPDHLISEEEKAILWRSIERIPETYREPLVLFYRQHQSVERVAEALDLTEDAVRQRLSRGRKLLQEQVLAFVEGALENTNPSKAFTIGVLAALPLFASTVTAASAATAGSAAAKGGATVKTAISLAAMGAVSAGLFFLFSLIGVLMFLGGCIGYIMSWAIRQSSSQLEYVIRFWRTITAGFGIFVVLPLLVAFTMGQAGGSHSRLFSALNFWMGLIYLLVAAALAIWLWQWWRESADPKTDAVESAHPTRKRLFLWLSLGMLVPACFFFMSVYSLAFEQNLTSQKLSGAELQTMIQHKDAKFSIEQHQNGFKELRVRLPENRRVLFYTEANPEILALLAENHIVYNTHVEGANLDLLGTPWRLLGFLSFFMAPVGAIILLRRPRKGELAGQQFDSPQKGKADKTSTNAFRAFATSVALVLLAAAIFLGLITRWNTQAVSVNEVPKILAQYKFARFEVCQYDNGSRDLHITPRNYGVGPFVAPANEHTLSLLAENVIPYRTLVQGRDFGYADPKPWLSAVLMIILILGAVLLLGAATKGTILRTFAFGAAFLTVFLLVLGVSLYQMAAHPKMFLSTARVKVSEWSNPAFPRDEQSVVASKPVLEPVIKALDLGKKWAQTMEPRR